MLKWAKRAALVLLGVVVLGALLFFALPWLVIGPADQPREADVILHFALAEELHGDEYAVELLRQGQAKHIVCLSAQASWQVYAADYARAHLIELGAPADQVSVLHTPRLECRKQVLPFIAEYVKQQGWRRVLMVVEPTVSRADRRVAAPIFARAGLELEITYSPLDYTILTTGWWRKHWKTQRFSGEALDGFFDFFFAECW